MDKDEIIIIDRLLVVRSEGSQIRNSFYCSIYFSYTLKGGSLIQGANSVVILSYYILAQGMCFATAVRTCLDTRANW